MLRAHPLTVGVCRDGAPPPLWATCAVPHCPYCKRILISSLKLPSLHLKSFPIVLSQQPQLKSLPPSFLQHPFRYYTIAFIDIITWILWSSQDCIETVYNNLIQFIKYHGFTTAGSLTPAMGHCWALLGKAQHKRLIFYVCVLSLHGHEVHLL